MYEQQRDQILGTQFNVDSLAGAQEQAQHPVAIKLYSHPEQFDFNAASKPLIRHDFPSCLSGRIKSTESQLVQAEINVMTVEAMKGGYQDLIACHV